ncbi:ras-domain-containing protein [Clavulina sp. PMI_390]|nr:ras-domain-containing protein [Clavulina sp. PMI_390]
MKCVVVGDHAVGKVFDTSAVTISLGKDQHTLNLFDTDGTFLEHTKRASTYIQSEVLLVCFSVVSPQSFQNVEANWVPEIRHYCPYVPWLLVGTQIDLREDPQVLQRLSSKGEGAVTVEQGEELARKLGAFAYVECSAWTQTGLKDVFDETVVDLEIEQAIRADMDFSPHSSCAVCVVA